MRKVSAILLAAGRGTRTGGFKPFMQWKGESFLSRVFSSLKESNVFQDITVVTGFMSARLEPELKRLGAVSIFNSEYDKGIHSSIRAGLRALRSGWDGALVAHIDQPQLEPHEYIKIVRSFQNSMKSLARPCFHGAPGNPAILGFDYLKEIEAETDADYGCAYLFKRHPEDALWVEMDNPACTEDFDTYP